MHESIAQVHANCVSIFLTFIDVLGSPYYSDDQNEARDVFDKYKLWAGNVGAMHGGAKYRMSLDYRLREASFYREQVLRLMSDLRSCLHHITLLKSLMKYFQALTAARIEGVKACDRIIDSSEPLDTDGDESDLSDSPWEVSSDSEVDNLSKQKLPQQVLRRSALKRHSPAKSALIDPINFTVDCLWRLPIRSPAPIDRMKKKHITDSSAYLPFDIMHVRDKFPNLNETVTARLAKMISKRRQLIRYRKDHTEALQEEEMIATEDPNLGHGHLPMPGQGETASKSAPSSKGPSQRTELTKATTWKKNALVASFPPDIGLYTASVSDVASTIASEQAANAITIRFPDRPQTKAGRLLDKFVCPYCSTAQVVMSERRWKKHVLFDLQPYVCTYPDCRLHEYFFENIDDWFYHESRTHRVEWFCNTEPHQSFVDNQDFLDHMYRVHSESLAEAQLLGIHHGFQRPSNVHSGTCTLCGKHAMKLKSHLALHLEQLALFAIPQTDYMPALDENDTSSNAARQSAPGSPGLLSTDEQSDVLSRVPSLELSERVEYGNDKTNLQDTEVRNDLGSVPDLLGHLEEGNDASWDHVTSKFKDARAAMYSEQVAQPTRRLSEWIPHGLYDEFDHELMYESPDGKEDSGVPEVPMRRRHPNIRRSPAQPRLPLAPDSLQLTTEAKRKEIQEGVDTPWDQIPPGFKDAQLRMNDEYLQEPPELQPMIPSVAPDADFIGAITETPPYPLIVRSERHSSQTQATEKLVPKRNAYEAPAYSHPTSGSEKESSSRRGERLKIPTVPDIEPQIPTKPPPSLRERAGRITSNLLSPFRSRKGSKEEQDPPSIEPQRLQQPFVPTAYSYPGGAEQDSYVESLRPRFPRFASPYTNIESPSYIQSPDRPGQYPRDSPIGRHGGQFNPAILNAIPSYSYQDYEAPPSSQAQRSTLGLISRTSNLLRDAERENATRSRSVDTSKRRKHENATRSRSVKYVGRSNREGRLVLRRRRSNATESRDKSTRPGPPDNVVPRMTRLLGAFRARPKEEEVRRYGDPRLK